MTMKKIARTVKNLTAMTGKTTAKTTTLVMHQTVTTVKATVTDSQDNQKGCNDSQDNQKGCNDSQDNQKSCNKKHQKKLQRQPR